MCGMIGKLGLSASAVPATGPEGRDETYVPIAPPPSPVLLIHPAQFNADLLQIDALELEAKAADKQIKYIGMTDSDQNDKVEEAASAIKRLSLEHQPPVIKRIRLSNVD